MWDGECGMRDEDKENGELRLWEGEGGMRDEHKAHGELGCGTEKAG